MIFCCGNGPLASICISFDDDRLAYDFCRVYPFRIIDSPNEVSMVVNRASGNTNIYAVYAPKYNIDAKGTKQEVIGYIDWLVDDTLRLKTSSEIVSIHGSSSIVQGKSDLYRCLQFGQNLPVSFHREDERWLYWR